MPKWLEHAALSVSDLDRSIAFYRDRLGLRLARVIESDAGSKLGEIVGIPGCRARIAHLESEKGMLELFEYRKPRGRRRRRTQADIGLSHIGFATADIHGEYGRLRDAGVNFFSPPVEFRPGAWVAYFRGPDGEVGELRQT
jgi:catechol 2,3-dioxygenase-like lactoylglutathione lyase family enzyme